MNVRTFSVCVMECMWYHWTWYFCTSFHYLHFHSRSQGYKKPKPPDLLTVPFSQYLDISIKMQNVWKERKKFKVAAVQQPIAAIHMVWDYSYTSKSLLPHAVIFSLCSGLVAQSKPVVAMWRTTVLFFMSETDQGKCAWLQLSKCPASWHGRGFNLAVYVQGMGGPQSSGQGCVVMVYGLNMEKINCEKLFNLFCLYGNVVRVSASHSCFYLFLIELCLAYWPRTHSLLSCLRKKVDLCHESCLVMDSCLSILYCKNSNLGQSMQTFQPSSHVSTKFVIIIIIIIAWKGVILDFFIIIILQSPHCAMNCLNAYAELARA